MNLGFHRSHRKIYAAEKGQRGGTNNKTGRSGQDLEIKVPAGTIVYDEETNEVIGKLNEIPTDLDLKFDLDL